MYAKTKHSGMTLIELIIFIVVVGIALAGILGVMNVVVKSSADPVLAKQSLAMADAVMEEVLSKSYADTNGVADTTRLNMDDVFDYNYFDGSSTSKKILGSQLMNGTTTPLPDTYWATVSVTNTTVSTKTMARITVVVTNPQNETLTLTGYRGNY